MIRNYEPTNKVLGARPSTVAPRFMPPRRPVITPAEAKHLTPAPLMLQQGINPNALPSKLRKSAERVQKIIDAQRGDMPGRREGFTRTGFGPSSRDAMTKLMGFRLKSSNPLSDFLKETGKVTRPITARELNMAVNRGLLPMPPSGLEYAQSVIPKPIPGGFEGALSDAPPPGSAAYNASTSVPYSVTSGSGADQFFNSDLEQLGPEPDQPTGGMPILLLVAVGAALSFF